MEQKFTVFAIIAFVGLLASSANAALVEWFEDFESGMDGWVASYQWLEQEPYDGDYSLYNGYANGHHAIRSIGRTAGAFEVTFEIYIRGNEGVGDDTETISYGITSGEVTAEAWDNFQIDLQVYIDNDDNKVYIRAWDGSTPSTGVEIAKQTWHTIRIVAHPDTANGGTYNWYLNGVLQASHYDFKYDVTDTSTGFAIWHWNTDNMLESFTDSINVQMVDPATCEDVRLAELLLPGDISGPDGDPDCRVNLLDLAVLTSMWLNCNDPEDVNCSPIWFWNLVKEYRWEAVGPGGGGVLSCPAISPHNDNILFSGSDMGGAMRSEDGGHTWQFLDGAQIRGIYDRGRPWEFHPTDSDLVFAGSQTAFLKSCDKGINWEPISGPWDAAVMTGWPLPSKGPHVIRFNFYNPDQGIIAFNDYVEVNTIKLFETLNSGENWSVLNDLPENSGSVIDVVFCADNTDVIIVGCQNDIYISYNHGLTWQSKIDGIDIGFNQLSGFAGASIAGKTVLYAAVPTEIEEGICTIPLYVSTDLGESWISVGRDSGLFLGIIEDQSPQYSTISSSLSDPNTAYVRYAGVPIDNSNNPREEGNGGIFKTTDGGNTWTEILFRHPLQASFNENDIWRNNRTCGDDWGWNIEEFGVYVSDTNSNCVFTSVEYTKNGGIAWRRTDAKELVDCKTQAGGMQILTSWNHYIDPSDSHVQYTANTDFTLWKSTDGSSYWDHIYDAGPNNYYAMAIDPDVPGRIWAVGSQIHDLPYWSFLGLASTSSGFVCHSYDYGQNWDIQQASGGLPDKPVTDVYLDTSSPVNSRTLWIAVMDDGFYKSEDNGMTWTSYSSGLSIWNRNAYRIGKDDHGRLYGIVTARIGNYGLAVNGDIYLSDDDGSSWEPIGDATEMIYPIDIAIDSRDPNTIYVSCFTPASNSNPIGGVWKTTNCGETWQKIFEGECFSVALLPEDNDVVFVSSVYHWTIPSNVGVFVSSNGGADWHKLDELPISRPHRFTFDYNNYPPSIYVTSFGQGLWKGTKGL